jgi:hypothetical protein
VSAVTRTKEVTLADAWANDEDGVTLEVEGTLVPVTIVEAAEFAVHLMGAAWEAAQSAADKDAEIAIAQLRERMTETNPLGGLL